MATNYSRLWNHPLHGGLTQRSTIGGIRKLHLLLGRGRGGGGGGGGGGLYSCKIFSVWRLDIISESIVNNLSLRAHPVSRRGIN